MICREISLISLQRDKAYTLEDFMALQTEQCKEAAVKLAQLREEIILVVLSALKVSA